MSHLITGSGPKYVPEVQILSMTSLDPIHQRSVTIILGQRQDASQPSPQSPLSPEKHITFMLELLVSWRWLQCRDKSIGDAGPPLPLFSAHPSVAQGNRIARARCLPQPPPCAAACVLPLWHCRIAPCAMQLERALPTEEARRSS